MLKLNSLLSHRQELTDEEFVAFLYKIFHLTLVISGAFISGHQATFYLATIGNDHDHNSISALIYCCVVLQTISLFITTILLVYELYLSLSIFCCLPSMLVEVLLLTNLPSVGWWYPAFAINIYRIIYLFLLFSFALYSLVLKKRM